ncbi:MAG: hypothetical protein ACTSU2_04390 [Promethearchaeota archaeon]
MKIFINTFVYNKLIEEVVKTFNRETRKVDDFQGFWVGKIDNDNLMVMDLIIESLSANGSLNDGEISDFDFSMKMAVVEDQLFSDGRGFYIIGILRTHNNMGTTPSPGDLLDLSTLQAINPKAVLGIFDIFKVKNANALGLKFYQLADVSNPSGDIKEIPWTLEDYNEIFLNELILRLPTNQVDLAQVDALVNKAKANIAANLFDDAVKFLKEAKKIATASDKYDPELAEKIDINLLEIDYKKGNFGRVLHGIESLKNKFADTRPDSLFAEMSQLLGRVLIKMGKVDAGLKAIDEAIKLFELKRNWKKAAKFYLLKSLIELPRKGGENSLKIILKALSVLSNMRSDHTRDNIINKLKLEQHAKNLIKTLPEKNKQKQYLKVLNEIADAHGYKIILEDF